MNSYAYLALAGIFVGVAVLAVAFAARKRSSAAVARVQAVIDFSLTAGVQQTGTDLSMFLENEPKQGALSGLATRLGGLFAGRYTAMSEEAIREQLMAAGMYTSSPRTVMGYRVLSLIGTPVLVFFVEGGVHGMLSVLMIAIAVFAGWIIPVTFVQRKARRRIETIDRALPDLIDLMCVMIEAGLSFPASMRLASEQFHPPLTDELRLTLQEQTMGLSISEALTHMAERADTPAMKAFVRAMSQGDRMGISMGQIMRNLAHEMRNRRRSSAEERAQKTPVLMLFPLVFLIFPALFIVLMTPAVINLLQNLKGF
jgi:tight adherence protein C